MWCCLFFLGFSKTTTHLHNEAKTQNTPFHLVSEQLINNSCRNFLDEVKNKNGDYIEVFKDDLMKHLDKPKLWWNNQCGIFLQLNIHEAYLNYAVTALHWWNAGIPASPLNRQQQGGAKVH